MLAPRAGVANDYLSFLERKAQLGSDDGFSPSWMPDFLFDFQSALTTWALRKGRSALFEDCGLGKSVQELVWAENVTRRKNRPVLIVTPLAVNAQMTQEGAKFGIDVRRSDDGTARAGLNVTNYERLHLFNPNDWAGVVCDESSAIKSFAGKRRKVVTEFMRKIEFRLLATATAAPNDFVELGTSSEALGQLGHMDMLNRFFKNDQNTSDTSKKWRTHGGGGDKWRFKGHAESHFWRWVCSWARAIRKPSDLGFDDSRFTLPPLIENQHIVKAARIPDGQLFETYAQGLWEEREEQRRTIAERCDTAAELVRHTNEPAVLWCHLNDEGKMLRKLLPEAREVSGADSPERKEETFAAFANGSARLLIIKPKIGAWGLNWQHCAHTVAFPSHSYEQRYQSIRRFWRFGQTKPVVVDTVTTEGGMLVLKNLQRKAKQADDMFTALVSEMNNSIKVNRAAQFDRESEVPSWLSSIK